MFIMGVLVMAAVKRKDSKGRVLKAGEHERKDGRYMYIYKNPQSSKKEYVYANTLQELREKEEQVNKDLLDGIDSASAKMTLNELFSVRMNLKKDLRESTRTNYLRMWKSCVQSSSIGNRKICDLKQIHIKTFYTELSKAGMKKNSIKLIHNLIFSALELAVDSDFIRKNPAKDCMKEIKSDADEKVPLNETEIQNLIKFCERSTVYSCHIPFLIIAIQSCMRVGELTGLTWQDVDMKKRIINVNHQLIYKNYGDGCKFHISKPKTEAGCRTIPMTQAVYDAFLEIKKTNMLLGKRCMMNVEGYDNFVFLSGSGSPLAVNAVNSFLLNIEKAYNKEHSEDKIPHLSAHVLRHTGCTLFASAGMELKVLQDLMGHADAQVTLNVYNHKSEERTAREIHRIDNVINL